MRRPVLVVLLVTACATGSPTGDSPGALPSWEARGQRIQLERVIQTERDAGTTKGPFARLLGGQASNQLFERPYGVAWEGSDLLITDPAAARVVRVAADGITRSPAGTVDDPIGVAVCHLGIVVTDARRGSVALLDHRLHRTRWLAEGLQRPTGIACTAEEIFVVETAAHRVLILDAAGRPLRTIGTRGHGAGAFNFPTSIAIGSGELFVGDTLNFRIQPFELPLAVALKPFGQSGDAAGEMPRIKGIAVDASGQLWITDAHLDQIAVYSAGGEFLTDIGRTGSLPGELSFPAGIAASPDGRIAVADSLNRRVQVFRVREAGAAR